jgi:hypothetical protein
MENGKELKTKSNCARLDAQTAIELKQESNLDGGGLKTCSMCKESKSMDSFSTKVKNGLTIHYAYCYPCKNAYARKYYKAKGGETTKRRESRIQRIRELKASNRAFMVDFLSGKKCQDCDNGDIRVFEFHHLGNKKFSISNSMGMPLKTILKELDKCIILCANCHKKRTAKENNWYFYL